MCRVISATRKQFFRGAFSFLSVLIAFSVGCSKPSNRQENPLVEKLGLSLRVPPGLTQTKNEEDGTGVSLTWRKDSTLVALDAFRAVDADEARNLLADKKMLMDSLFEEHRSPYAGNSTNQESCPKAFLPTIYEASTESMTLVAYESAANNRFVFGGCTAEARELLAVYALVYCPLQRTFFEVRYFTPPTSSLLSPKVFIKSLHCLS